MLGRMTRDDLLAKLSAKKLKNPSENIDKAISFVENLSTDPVDLTLDEYVEFAYVLTVFGLEGVTLFPPDNPWNQRVDTQPVDPKSATYLANMAPTAKLHPDFGSSPDYGIPWVVVPGTQPRVPITFKYADESDPGPYPIPPDAPIEGGDDKHIIVVDRDAMKLYEVYLSAKSGQGWTADSGAIFDLRSNTLRQENWTSADAAGLPILPGLVRLSEVKAGRIPHALRFTMRKTQKAHVHPATHHASSIVDPNFPPMGMRVRLKASFDISKFNQTCKVILTAMKEYGMFLADNGGDWFFSGEMNPAWVDDDIALLKTVPATAFEAVQLGTILK